MSKVCFVCKQTAVVAARITRGDQIANVYLCENCTHRVSKIYPVEIVGSNSPTFPKGTKINPSPQIQNQVSQTTTTQSARESLTPNQKSVSPPHPGRTKCYNCGAMIPFGTKFCPECGASMSVPAVNNKQDVNSDSQERVTTIKNVRQGVSISSERAYSDISGDGVQQLRPSVICPPVTEPKKRLLLQRLEELYPEHKVFALSGLDEHLREDLAESYSQLGYSTVEEFLHKNGYEIISGDAVQQLRSFVLYPPGTEPDVIAQKIRSVLNRLLEYYPDRKILGSIQSEHKSLANNISALYQWLGYDSLQSMLEAYGYEYITMTAGRPATDYDAVVDFLVEKYKTEPKPKNMGILIYDNPDLRGALKTMQNRAPELFGMPLKQYFEDLGLFADKATADTASTIGDKAPAGGKMQEAARTELRRLYAEKAQGDYGTTDELEAAIASLTMKQNKAGQIYLGGAAQCPEHLKIPYGVHSISDGAFAGCTNLREVLFPETLREIGKEAFAGCTSLETIKLPANLTEIGKRAFAECVQLNGVNLSRCKAKISVDAFDPGAVSVKPGEDNADTEFDFTLNRQQQITITGYRGPAGAVRIPAEINGFNVTAIAREAFSDHTEITEVDMADTIVSLGAQAFRGCSALRRAHLSEHIERLYTNTFNGCTSLQEINIPDAVTELKNNTFSEAPLHILHIGRGLPIMSINALRHETYDTFGTRYSRGIVQKVTVSPENPYLQAEGSMLFSKDGTILFAVLGGETIYDVPEGVTGIAADAFSELTDLADVVLPSSLVTIGERAFYGTALRSIHFGSALRHIGKSAFAYCQKLSAVMFEDGIETIGDDAFSGCPIISLALPASINELGDNSFSFLSGYGWDTSLKSLEVDPANPWFSTEDGGFYQIVEGKKTLRTVIDRTKTSYTVANGTVQIAAGAFRFMSELRHLFLPNSLREIGGESFCGCSGLVNVSLPEGLKHIGDRAFDGVSLQLLTIPASLELLGRSKLVVDEITVEDANQHFFTEDHILYERLHEGGVVARAFFGETDRLLLRRDTYSIASYSFQSAKLEVLYIPRSVSIIEDRAFEDCQSLSRLYIEQPDGDRWAAVYLPQMNSSFLFTEDTSQRSQLMDCIRFNQSGNLFDFVKYDSLFEAISDEDDKILIAADRLCSTVDLMPIYQQTYERFLKEDPTHTLNCVIKDGDVFNCHLICNLGIITSQNLPEALALANERGDAEITSLLLTYQRDQKLDADPMAEFTLEW